MRRLTLTIASLLLGTSASFAQNLSAADQCVGLAARGEVAQLQQVYDSLQNQLPDYVQYYCRLAFARAKGDNREIVDAIDTLENQYAQHFDDNGLFALCEEKCEALRQLGEYPTLQTYCQNRITKFAESESESSRFDNLKTYQRISNIFTTRQPIKTEWQSNSFAVSISRDWPLLVPVKVGKHEEAPFFFDTSSQYTFISKDDAREWGITVLGDPVMLDTPTGFIKARPVIIGQFTIGELTLRDVMVFVVSDEVAPPYNRTLGNDVMRHMQKIEINDQQLIVIRQSHALASSSKPIKKNGSMPICFNSFGGIDVQMPEGDGYQRFILDSSMPEDADENDLRFKGVEFLKGSASVIIDFTRMTLTPLEPREYKPRKVADYLETEDYFELLRNETALEFSATDEEMELVDEALDRALTPPDPAKLSPAIQAAIVSPERAATFSKEPHQLLVTSKGLIYERIEGKRRKTMLLTDKVAASHKIDIQNLKIY